MTRHRQHRRRELLDFNEAEAREALARRMTAASRGTIVNTVIPFINDDVPEYLDNLRRFREESQKVSIPVE